MQRILQALWACGVDYVVIGGVAVALWGIPRTTVDLDVAVRLTPQNLEKLWQCLETLGLRPRQPVGLEVIKDRMRREQVTREKGMRVLTFENPDDPLEVVDVLLEEVVPFEELHARRKVFRTASFGIPVASVPDLIVLKTRSGRPVDVSDIQALRMLEDHEAS